MFNPDQVSPIKPNPKVNVDGIGRTKPLGNPRSDKDFKKMVDNDLDSQEELVANVEEQEQPVSLFELSAKKSKSAKKSTPTLNPEQQAAKLEEQSQSQAEELSYDEESLADLELLSADQLARRRSELPPSPFLPKDKTINMGQEGNLIPSEQENLAQAEKMRQFGQNEIISEEINREQAALLMRRARGSDAINLEDTPAFLSKDKTKRSQARSEFAQENSDLAYINPVASRQDATEIKASIEGKEISRASVIKEIIDQLVQSIQTIKQEGRTETVVTLRHPPQFEGANVTLTAFNSAKNEFNIAFNNLTAPAKQFLDRKLTEDSLTAALEQKGFVIHIITTSTVEAPVINVESEKFGKQDQRGSGQQQQRQQRGEEDQA